MLERARLEADGDLLSLGGFRNNVPVVERSLASAYNFDGRAGNIDKVNGQFIPDEIGGVNLAEIFGWRDPKNWILITEEDIDNAPNMTGITWDEVEQAICFTGKHRSCMLRKGLGINPNVKVKVSFDIMVADGGLNPDVHMTYVGGRRENFLNKMTTKNYDYSIIGGSLINAMGGIGTWKPILVIYEDDPNIRYPTGWKAESDSNACGSIHNMTDKWYFGGLFNYNATGVDATNTAKTYIRNLKIEIIDGTQANNQSRCLFTNDGIEHFRDDSTNLFGENCTMLTKTEVMFNAYGSPAYRVLPSTLHLFDELPHWMLEIMHVSADESGGTLNNGLLLSGPKWVLVAGSFYTLSFYGKGWEDRAPLSVYYTNCSDIKITKLDVGLGWTKYSIRYKAVTASANLYLRANGNKDYSYRAYLALPKLAKSDKPSPITRGSKVTFSDPLSLPVDRNGIENHTDYTIYSRHKFTMDRADIGIDNLYKIGDLYLRLELDDENAGSKGICFMNQSTTFGYKNLPSFVVGDILDIFVRRFGSTLQYDIFKNGVGILTWSGTPPVSNPDNVGRVTGKPIIELQRSTLITQRLYYYSSKLTSPELNLIANDKARILDNGCFTGDTLDEGKPGYTLVYHGPATSLVNRHSREFILCDKHGMEFDEMLIEKAYYGITYHSAMPKTAVLKYPLSWYINWLFDQPDDQSPKIKFHGTDGVHDVQPVNSGFIYGYGNSWRRLQDVYINRSESTRLYVGSYYDSNLHDIKFSDFKSNNGNGYISAVDCENNVIRDSMKKITALEYQTIKVWVKKNDSPKNLMKFDKDLEIYGELKEVEVI